MAFWLRFANLDIINLFNDEYYQFDTAVGLLETGEYNRYNFYTGETEESYTRAKIYTWQIAQSMKFFGYTETAARFPAVFWGTILAPLLIIVLLLMLKNPWVAYGSGLLVTFDNFFVEMSRFTRMYSMVFVLTILVLVLVYKFLSAQSKKSQIIYGILSLGFFMAYFFAFEELSLALGAGIGIYILVRAIQYLWKKERPDKLFAYLFVGGASLAISGVIIHFAGYYFIPVDAFIIRDMPHFFYLTEVFSELHIPKYGMFFFLIGILFIKSNRSFEAFITIIGVSLLTYFVYLSHRWEAKRYIGFIIPIFYIMITLGIYQFVKLLGKMLPITKIGKGLISVTIFILVGPWLSFPGLHTDYFFVQTAYADLSYDSINRANVEKAYQFVTDNYKPGEIVFIQGPRYYYWPDNSIPIVELGANKSLPFDEFVQMVQSAKAGGWVVYNARKTKHLEKKIRHFAANNMEYHYELDDTLVFIFRFAPADVKNKKIETL